MKHIEIGGRVGGGRRHPGRLVLFLALSMIAVPANASWWEDAWNYVAEKIGNAQKKEQATQTCPPREPATGKTLRIEDPGTPSTCLGLKLCNYCEYDSAGQFIKNDSDVCGLCLTFETP